MSSGIFRLQPWRGLNIREVNDIEEGKKLVNSILAMVAQKQLLKEQ